MHFFGRLCGLRAGACPPAHTNILKITGVFWDITSLGVVETCLAGGGSFVAVLHTISPKHRGLTSAGVYQLTFGERTVDRPNILKVEPLLLNSQ